MREVHALDQAACELVAELDRLFDLARFPGWQPIRNGFRLEVTREEIGDYPTVYAVIYPAGWPPNSYISFKACRWRNGWLPQFGAISADHLGIDHRFEGGPLYLRDRLARSLTPLIGAKTESRSA